MVPSSPLLRHWALLAHHWQGEGAGPHPKPGSPLASCPCISRCVWRSSSEKGSPASPARGLQPVPPASEHQAALTLWEVDRLVLRSLKKVPALQRLGVGVLPGRGASPAWLQGLCLFSQCVRIPVSALPTGGNALKKISVINVVSFVVSHCKGSKRGFIFLTCLA